MGDVEALAEVIEREYDLAAIADGIPAPFALARVILRSDWLTAHVTAIATEAWDEGWRQGTGDAWQNGGHESKPNPYREDLRPREGA